MIIFCIIVWLSFGVLGTYIYHKKELGSPFDIMRRKERITIGDILGDGLFSLFGLLIFIVVMISWMSTVVVWRKK